jgi:hypothetical protein
MEKEKYLEKIEVCSLSNEDKDTAEGMILFEELTKSMNSFKNNKDKAPGNDGITVESYRKCWGIIGKPLLNTLNYSIHSWSALYFSKTGDY